MEAMVPGWSRGATIGRGSSATVSLATFHDSGAVFAVKSAQLPSAAQLRREHSVLSSLSSPHIVRCLGTDVTREGGSEFYNLFMEYFPRGTLCDEIRRQGGRLPEPEIRRHARSVLLGLRYLHGIGIVHRDIKGSNLLVAWDGEVRIGDLGCASRMGGAADVGGLAGTPLFMAPEVARGQSQGYAADVWALGCTVVEMATGRPPWAVGATDLVSALYRIGCTDAVPEMPENLSEEGQDFLRKCFRRNPSDRWTAEQLLEHPFVGKLNPVDNQGKPFCDSPNSILNRDLWDSLESRSVDAAIEANHSMPVLAPAPTAANRIKALFSPASRRPDWSWRDDWVCVREKAPENLPVRSISGEVDFEEPAIESTSSRGIDGDPIVAENSATLNGGVLGKEIDGHARIDERICAIDFIHSVGTVDDFFIPILSDDYVIKMHKMQLIEMSLLLINGVSILSIAKSKLVERLGLSPLLGKKELMCSREKNHYPKAL